MVGPNDFTGALDPTGFYYVNTLSWTLTRVDFPPSASSGGATLTLQSAPKPTGPWAAVAKTEVPAEKSSEFYRLEIEKR